MKKLYLLCALVLLGISTLSPSPTKPVVAPEPSALPVMGQLRFDWPIQNAVVTSAFGYRTDVKLGTDKGGADASLHFGLDLIPAAGTPYQIKRTQVFAAETGEVYVVYPPPGTPIPGSKKTFPGHISFGGCVMIKHLVGIFGGKDIYAYTLYGHMKEVWISEKNAQGNPTKILKGQVIGLMGSTGQSTGPHVHFEILFDPLDFLRITTEMAKMADQEKDRAKYVEVQRQENYWIRAYRYN